MVDILEVTTPVKNTIRAIIRIESRAGGIRTAIHCVESNQILPR